MMQSKHFWTKLVTISVLVGLGVSLLGSGWQDTEKAGETSKDEAASGLREQKEEKKKEKPKPWDERFDEAIKKVNSVIEESLFWSVTGDTFKKTALTDSKGVTQFAVTGKNKVGDRTGGDTTIPGGKINPSDDGYFVDDQGRVIVLMEPDGTPLYVAGKDGLIVDAAGKPFVVGDEKIGEKKSEFDEKTKATVKKEVLKVSYVFLTGPSSIKLTGDQEPSRGRALKLTTSRTTTVIPGKEEKTEEVTTESAFSFLDLGVANKLKLSGRSDFVDNFGKPVFRLDFDGKQVHPMDEFVRVLKDQPKTLPGNSVQIDANGVFVDAQGRPVVVVKRDGTVVLLADADGKLIDSAGRAVVFQEEKKKDEEPKVIELSFVRGSVLNKAGAPVNLLALGKRKEYEFLAGNLLQVHRITALQQERSGIGIPFLIVILVVGAIFFTFWFRWISVRGLKHSLDIIRGKYDNPDDKGEISHFRALTSALSATVGLGNIAGVAIAIQMGGPGAVFWMWVTAVFGMAAKFSSCTLAQLYRQENKDGSISGGPMYYLDLGLRAKGGSWIFLGKVLAVMYAFMIMGGALGGGNMFQANQSFQAFSEVFGIPEGGKYLFGVAMAIVVGLVILGGIKRIGAATSKIVPIMCGLYIAASLFVIGANIEHVGDTFSLIFNMAFSQNAFLGGMVGVLIMGVKRAAFSNEAGLGSAAIAHAAAKTDEPVREGMVAMVGPFIDTIVVCTMTALVVIITGMWENPEVGAGAANAGVALTVAAFQVGIAKWFAYILAVCIIMFAYSTMISWCYYGERGWMYLTDHLGEGMGLKTVILFRIVFVGCVFVGAVANLGAVLDFSDLMILCMAFPNIVGSVLLAPHVLEKLKDYWGRYKSGAMKTFS